MFSISFLSTRVIISSMPSSIALSSKRSSFLMLDGLYEYNCKTIYNLVSRATTGIDILIKNWREL
jgi:hypothetical protein